VEVVLRIRETAGREAVAGGRVEREARLAAADVELEIGGRLAVRAVVEVDDGRVDLLDVEVQGR
jgi:hypothetical protein